MSEYQEVTFTDELLSGGGVYRRFSDGVEEWRWRDPEDRVWWRDNQGRHGTDEPLLGGIIKRTYLDGEVRYGRDLGFGWTSWSERRLTLNKTNFPEGPLALLIRIGPRALFGKLPAPPAFLTPAQEEKLRPATAPNPAPAGGRTSVEVSVGVSAVDWTVPVDTGFVDDFG